MTISTLLTVLFVVCVQHTLVLSTLQLEASDKDARSTWGVNDVMLTCRDGDEEVANAIFTRNGVTISTSADGNCSPSSAYCVDQEHTSRLSFTASSETEGKFACKNDHNDEPSNEIAILGKRKCFEISVM